MELESSAVSAPSETISADTSTATPTDSIANTDSSPVKAEASPSEPSSDPIRSSLRKTYEKINGEPSTETDEAPASWSADKKSLWSQLPPDARQYIAEREMQAQSRISELGREAAVRGQQSPQDAAGLIKSMQTATGWDEQTAHSIGEYVSRNQQAHNLSFGQQLAIMFNGVRALESDPLGSIMHLCKVHGIDLARYAPQGQELERSRYEIQQQQQAMQQQYSAWQQQQQQQEHQRLLWIDEQANKFTEGKDYWNAPGFEDAVEQQIIAIRARDPGRVSLDPIGVLKEAEQSALRVTGVTTKNAMVEAKKRADEAKRLASMNVKTSGYRGGNPSQETLRESLTRVYDRLHPGR